MILFLLEKLKISTAIFYKNTVVTKVKAVILRIFLLVQHSVYKNISLIFVETLIKIKNFLRFGQL